MERTIQNIAVSIISSCYNCICLIISCLLILKMSMKISELQTLRRRQKKKDIFHTLLLFCLAQSHDLYNSSRRSCRPDNAHPRTPRRAGRSTGLTFDPGNENARANVLELITRASAICTAERNGQTLLRNRSIYNLYTRFARSYKFTPAIKGFYRTLSFIYNCLLTSH